MIKNNKKCKKWVHLSREPTWMRRGAQGHVAVSHGPVRVPAWHNDDVCIYILLYYAYRTYKPSIEDIANLIYLRHVMYPIFLLNLLRVGLFVFVLFCFKATWQHSSHWIKIAMKDEHGCGGRDVHLIEDHARAAIFT